MTYMRRWPLLMLAALSGCGGDAPIAPTATATPSPQQTYPVSVMVFYDENKNGVLDPSEGVRLPNVSVTGGGKSAQTATGGVATFQAPSGSVTLTLSPDSLPAYYQAGAPATVTVPGSGQTLMAATLPIG